MNIKIIIFWSLLFISNVFFAQENGFVIPDSLKIKELLKKAKLKQDTIEIIKNYKSLLKLDINSKTAISFTDSLVDYSKNSPKYKYELANAYLQKGFHLYNQSKHKEALKFYVKANDIYIKNKKKYAIDLLRIRHNIGLLKNEIGKEKEALNIFKKNILFFKTDSIKLLYKRKYLLTLFALANTYNRNHIIDSVIVISTNGLNECEKYNENSLKHLFSTALGIAEIQQQQNQKGIDRLIKSSKNMTYKTTLCDTYLWISEGYYNLNKTNKFVYYLNKIDSIYSLNKEVYSQSRTANERLYKYYKKKKNIDLQLKTVNRIIYLDSIYDLYNKNLDSQILSDYNIPSLIREREILASELNSNKKRYSNTQYYSIAVIFIFILLLAYSVNKRIVLNKKFNKLLNAKELKEKNIEIKNTNTLDLPEQLIKNILDGLNQFELSLGFLELKLTQNKLAKKLNTNSTYLSKIINHYKGVNFSNYLSELRINYAIKTLKLNKTLYKFSIDAIANEFGFSNSESFSKAFYKKTNIYPSFFIKKLREKE